MFIVGISSAERIDKISICKVTSASLFLIPSHMDDLVVVDLFQKLEKN